METNNKAKYSVEEYINNIIEQNYNEDMDYNDSDNDNDSDYSEDNIYYIQNQQKEAYINEDFEPILTLSKTVDILQNKKIQVIKQRLNILLEPFFTQQEQFIIHSIYNLNKDCLLQRNKILKEYKLIKIILELFSIRFSTHIVQGIFPPIPWLDTSKKSKKIIKEIKETFAFKQFCQLYDITFDTQQNNIRSYIYIKIVNGISLILKNILIIKKQQQHMIEFYQKKNIIISDLEKTIDLFLENRNNCFCRDMNLTLFTSWLSNLVKKLLVFILSKSFDVEQKVLYDKQKLETQIYITINYIFWIITILHTSNKYDNVKILLLLTLHMQDNKRILELLKDKNFYYLINYFFEKQFIKVKTSYKTILKMMLSEL